MHVIAAKAVAFGEALKPDFKTYSETVVKNAQALAQTIKDGGSDIISGGTDTHLLLVDLRAKLGNAAITCNKNGIPFDPESPFVTSGVRLGSPAATTRGFGEAEFKAVGTMINKVLDGLAANGEEGNKTVEAEVKQSVLELTSRFPIY